MTGCIGIPPHSPRQPGLLWGYAAAVQEVAKLRTPKQFRGNANALIVSTLLQDGLRGIHDMLYSNEISRHRAERHRTRAADTQSFLVQFATARRGIDGVGRDAWWPFYEEMCHRQAELAKSFRSPLPRAERVALCMFLVELEDWLVPEVRRQVQA